MLLELSHVSKIYGDLAAVDDLSLTVPRGQWLSIVGSSGSGKTTLMNIIGCMDTPTKGTVTLDGRELGSLTAGQLTDIRKNVIGLVFQQFHLIPHLTAVENVMVAQYYHSMVDEKEARQMLDSVGLADRAGQVVSTLSGGQASRASIACALVGDPEVMVLDEPTVGLDPLTRESLWDVFRELARQGRTLLVSSHVMDEAMRCDRLILMRRGRVLGVMTPAQLLEATGQDTPDRAFLALVREDADDGAEGSVR